MFSNNIFNSFHAKSPQNSKVFCYTYDGCPNWNLLWRFGLNIRLDGVLVTVFVSHSFSCFIDLKMNTTTTMATPMVSFDSVFHMLSEKVTFFLLLLRGTRFLFFEWWFLVKNLKTMNHLKTITMVSMETKFASQDSILDKLSENFTWVDSEKGNRVFTRGGGALCAPPPPPGAPKKPALDRVNALRHVDNTAKLSNTSQFPWKRSPWLLDRKLRS